MSIPIVLCSLSPPTPQHYTKVMRLLLALLSFALPSLAAPCEELASMALPEGTITLAQAVDAGAFAPPAAVPDANASAFKDLPAFCRVAATLKPTADSDIKIEVWMPAAMWNGKFLANGNGGWTGSINYGSLATSLRRGYATAMTDTGHE